MTLRDLLAANERIMASSCDAAIEAMLPAGVAAMGVLAAGRTIVLTFPHNAWPTVTGILVQAERTRSVPAWPTGTGRSPGVKMPLIVTVNAA